MLSLIDNSSGAAVAMADALRLLSESGFDCYTYCACKLDFGEEVIVEQFRAEQRLAVPRRPRRTPEIEPAMAVNGRPVRGSQSFECRSLGIPDNLNGGFYPSHG
jgi:hypothetical protein